MKGVFVLLLSLRLFAIDMITPILADINKVNISEYLISEKLDGLRAFWDGKNLISKNNFHYNPPKSFIKDFPPFKIDGELYCGMEFEKTASDVRSGAFKCAKLYVFEVPEQKGNLEERLKVLKEYLKTHPNDNIKIIPQLHFKDKKDFLRYFDELSKNGAEGVVLHRKDTKYSTKKGLNIIKYKKYYKSTCKITKLNKSDNLLKNYECEWDLRNAKEMIFTKEQKALYKKLKNNKTIVKIGSGFSNSHRQNPLKIGDIIEFKFYKLSKNLKPIHSVFLNKID